MAVTREEYARIQKILGRDPNITELGIFSVMWSEHCSYKSSKVHLKRLPTRGQLVVQGREKTPAWWISATDWWRRSRSNRTTIRVMSSRFRERQPASAGFCATFSRWARGRSPVLDSLRFGEISCRWRAANAPGQAGIAQTTEASGKNRRILDGVIRGIAHYGNCFGVPTVGGEVAFEPCYSQNPLVNALALGIARKEDMFFAKAKGAGNPVIYVGAKTGRDGIHGASLLASAEFTEESQQKRPNVQVGDPFMEKLLLEACLEAMKTGAVVAIQDMGAAGLTCSTCEMASRGATGHRD